MTSWPAVGRLVYRIAIIAIYGWCCYACLSTAWKMDSKVVIIIALCWFASRMYDGAIDMLLRRDS